MPGPLTKSVCVLYLTFSRANSMLCLPSARRELGAASRQGRQRGLPRRAPPPGAGMGRPGSLGRAGPRCLVHPLGACGPGQWLCRPVGTGEGCGAGHGRHQPALTVPGRRWPVPLPVVRCAVGTRGSGTSCPCSTRVPGSCAVPGAPHIEPSSGC